MGIAPRAHWGTPSVENPYSSPQLKRKHESIAVAGFDILFTLSTGRWIWDCHFAKKHEQIHIGTILKGRLPKNIDPSVPLWCAQLTSFVIK